MNYLKLTFIYFLYTLFYMTTEEKEQKSIRIEKKSLDTIKKILKSEKDHEALVILWEPRNVKNRYGDEDVLPEEIQEIIATLRQYNRVKNTTYRFVILPTISPYEFGSFNAYVRYAIDLLNAFIWGGMDKGLVDKVKYWKYRRKKK